MLTCSCFVSQEHVDGLKATAQQALDKFATDLRAGVGARLGVAGVLTAQPPVKAEQPGTSQQQQKGVKAEAGSSAGSEEGAAAALPILQQIDGIWLAAQVWCSDVVWAVSVCVRHT